MYPGDFERAFNKISEVFTLDLISEEKDFEENFPKRNPKTPIWDTINSLQEDGFLDIGNKRYVSYKNFFKNPVRILFFIMISELESRLFRISKWSGKDISELNEQNLNNLIKDLLDSDLINLQTEYQKRNEFKEDLKAISSFRNIIVHVNKKLDKEIDHETLIKRKTQIIKLLSALQQTLDGMEIKFEKRINYLTKEDIENLKASIGSIENSIKEIYLSRRLRNLLGKDSVIERTFGEDLVDLRSYKKTYYDEKRGLHVKTEFSEAMEALENFNNLSNQKNEIKLHLEVGDLLVQKKIVSIYHQNHPSYDKVIEKFNMCIAFFENELNKRLLDTTLPEKLVTIKQGTRAWLRRYFPVEKAKDKKLEYELCKELLEKEEIIKNSTKLTS